MSRPLPGSRIALMLRRLRGRFGIAAPRVAVRTHIPWYLHIAGVLGVAAFALVLAGWAYDAGRRIAGFDQGEVGQVVRELSSENRVLKEEVARLRGLLTASESSLQIEQSAQRLLSEKSTALAEENARLKEDLAVFERLSRLEGNAGDEVSLDRLSVRPDTLPGRYRFSFLIALQGARRGKESHFNLQIVVSPRTETPDARIITLPLQGDPDFAQYDITLRNFRRIEGGFSVPKGYVVGAVEIRIFEAGVLKGSKNLSL
jgi:hypothetical protein